MKKRISNKQLTQNDFEAQIDKLYIAEDFIYFSLTTGEIGRDSSLDYDQRDYISDEETQCFLIDRTNKKIYSLADMPNILYIDNYIVHLPRVNSSEIDYFMLKIEQDQIKFIDLVTNKNMIITRLLASKDGIVLIENDITDNIIGNCIYTMPDQWYDRYYSIGTDGKLYRSYGYGYSHNYRLQMFDKEDMSWKAPDTNAEFRVYLGDNYATFSFGKLYLLVCSTYGSTCYVPDIGFAIDEDYFSDSDCIRFVNGLQPSGVGFTSYSMYGFASRNIVLYSKSLNKGNLFLVNFFTEQGALGIIKIEEEKVYNRFESCDDYVLGVCESISGTEKYKIYVDENGEPQVEPFSSAIYQSNIITIKPLN